MSHTIVDNLAALRVSGDDAADFLQGQLTADLTRLGDGDSAFAAYCHPKGNVIAVMYVFREGDDYVLIAARDLRDTLISELRKYVLRAKVEFESLTGRVVGREAGDSMAYGLERETADNAAADFSEADKWRAAELRRGIVWLSPQTSGQFLPQMLGLERLGAISFRKGCYPGQEVIARVRYLGKVKQLPLVVSTESPVRFEPARKVELTGADGPVGSAVVIDSAPDGRGSVVFMVARVRNDSPVSAIQSGDTRVDVGEILRAPGA